MLPFKPFLVLLVVFSCVAYGSLVDDIVDAIVNAVDCASCHALLLPLQATALLGDSAFSSVIIAVCKALKVRNWTTRAHGSVFQLIDRCKTRMYARELPSNKVLSSHTICDPSLHSVKPQPSSVTLSSVFANPLT